MNERQVADATRAAYDTFAAFYDDYTSAYEYEYRRWSGRLLEKAKEAGLSGDRLLDVGCGTGLSFVEVLDRGLRVTACDISPEMLEVARSRAAGRAELLVADMRELPELGEFDLVWAVNDPINYLLSVEDLAATLAGMRRNLAPQGLALFDLISLRGCRAFFSEQVIREKGGRQFMAEGQLSPEQVVPGTIGEVRFEAKGEPESAHVHRLRHFPEGDVLAAIDAIGLDCVGVFGEMDGDLQPGLDEETHTMAVYICRA
jgi:ubiquinone/menaquinone biosynthesis C-methylase UbiE